MNMKRILKMLAASVAIACCVMLAPATAQAYGWTNKATGEVWGFDVFQNDDGELEATINWYSQVDDKGKWKALPDSLDFVVPATVPVVWTNEFGYLENVFDGEGKLVDHKFVTTSGPEEKSAIVKVTGVALAWDSDAGKLVSATFPDSVTWVSGFIQCVNLATVVISDDAEFSGGAFIGSPWLKGLGELVIRNDVLVAYQGTATAVTVPDGVVAIGDCAFNADLNGDMANLTSVTLPASVEEIRDSAFAGCRKLSTINIPEAVTSIGHSAFDWCESLAKVTLPACLEYLGYGAFRGTAITEISVPERIESLQGFTFSDCANLTTVSFRGPLEAIGDNEFDACPKLASIMFPNSLKEIGGWAFNGSALTEVTLPGSLEFIGYGAFKDCANLATVTGGANVKDVWQEAFLNTALYNGVTDGIVQAGTLVVGYNGTLPAALVIPEGVTCIGYDVFHCNTDIMSVALPASLHTIDYEAFGECSNLATVTGGSGVQSIDDNVFYDTPYEKSLTKDCDKSDVPFGFVRLGTVILSYTGVCSAEIVVPDDVTQIYEDVFAGDEHSTSANITSVTIGAGVREIGSCAFSELKNLTTVTGGGAVYHLDDMAFAECPKLTDFSLAGPLTWIDPNVFGGDFSLANVAFELAEPDDDNEFFLSTGLFNDCDKLASVKVTFPGYTLEGWEARIDNAEGWKVFADELATFRLHYKQWYDSETWYPAEVNYHPLWSNVNQPVPEEKAGPENKPEPIPELWSTTEAVQGNVPEAAASVYDGFLYNKDKELSGTVQVKVAKPKNGSAKVTVAFQPVGGKKTTVKGTLDVATGKVTANGLDLTLGADGMSGAWDGYDISGSRNLFASKNKAEQNAANDLLKPWLGAVNVAWEGVQGWDGLTMSVAKKGKTKASGILSSGTKVSANCQLVMGAEWCCIPMVWSRRREKVAFTLWLPLTPGAAPRVVGLGDGAKVGKPGMLKADAKFKIDADAFSAMWKKSALPYLPDGLAVSSSATKWTLPKAGAVKATKDGGIDETKLGENPSGLKLTYKSKEGSFKGPFKAYAYVSGKPKATTVNVTGVLVNGVGYGAATVKKAGGVPVTVE